MTKEQFIENVAKYVKQYAPLYGIKCYSAVISQAILESACGTSELATNANNFFGLKYNPKQPKRCPTACGYYTKVGSEQNKDGSYVSSTMLWQKFPSFESGIKGYFDFINNSNYANLKGITDPQKYLETIREDKYCTSLSYVQNCMNIVSKYNLKQYDTKGVDNKMTKVAIDAGHYSNCPGKRTPDNYQEHTINVKTAYYCEQYLKSKGIETVRIGWDDTNSTDDADVSLSTRQKQIKNAKCDYSVSCHANAYGSGWNSANGVETLISNVASYQKDSLKFAQCIQNRLIQGTKQTNRGVKKQSLAMCNCKAMGTKASCLIEIGFMTNKIEANLMKTDAFCKEQGEDIAKGICDYLGIKNNTTPSSSTTISSSSVKFLHGGIDYSPVFDPTYYANKYADLKAAFGTDANKLFSHFINNGMKESRQAISTFNVTAYKNRYADLQKAFGNDLPAYYRHYITNGKSEGRSAV